MTRHEGRRAQTNGLLAAASALLNAMAHCRYAPPPEDAGALRLQLIDEVRRFEQVCRDGGQPYNQIIGARYCLCTSLDEAIGLTDWGKNSIWAGNGLLVAFHNETNGGEKFFQLMATLLQQPEMHIDLLEVIHFCLLLGFGGRYRVMENGVYRLEILTQRLARQINAVRGDYPSLLGDPCSDKPAPRRPSRVRLAAPLCMALAGIVLCSLYIGFNSRLVSATGELKNRLFSLRLPKAPSLKDTFSLPDLLQALTDDIAANRVAVILRDDRVIISLRGGDVFATASASLQSPYLPIIDRIARHLALSTYVITVRGHTDNQPIVSGAFRSNQALALARAESVALRLRQTLYQPGRIIVESAGERSPLAPNTTPENRAINRRIDILFTLTAAGNESV